jgi:tetratricopeptide (TPR) repeat protein
MVEGLGVRLQHSIGQPWYKRAEIIAGGKTSVNQFTLASTGCDDEMGRTVVSAQFRPASKEISMKGSRVPVILSIAVVAALSCLSVARAEVGEKTGSTAKISEVDFPVSCGPAAQKKFNQAVWILHSFWYDEAVKAFTAVTEIEPDCAMGYWGVAMSHWYPLWYPPNAAALKAGSEAVDKAAAAKPKTDRERDYIVAIAAFYRDNDKVDHRTRAVAYEKAMEQVHSKYPDDREAGVFYSLALLATAPPTDKTYANQKKARAILEQVRAELPDHPGVAHYLIHANDSPAMAEDGLTAALCYAAIAPAVPHALHMPSHIFTRLGLWQQSIDANRAASAAALAYVREELGPGAFDGETVHSLDYLEYAYLQTGQDRAAKEVVEELRSFGQAKGPNLPMAYAIAAIPARYAVERRNWAEAAALTPPAMPFPWDRFPWAEAMISFTRALGAAHTGNIAEAQSEIAQLQSLKQKLDEAKDDYWAKQVEVQRLGAAGMLAYAQGDNKQALELVRAAAELDATMDKHPATPAEVLPARELLADLLLGLGDPAAALKEYEQSLGADRNRFRSMLGMARAAKATGDTAKARQAYEKLVTLASADSDRPELAEARAFLAN